MEDETEDKSTSLEDLHAEFVESFSDHYDHWSEKHEDIRKELRFSRLGQQWDEDDLAQRENEGKPTLTINKLPSFARRVINDARQNKPAIKVFPADDKADIKTAEVMNGLIRNIEYVSDAEVAYDTALESAVYCSWGFFEIDVDYTHHDMFAQDILIKRIPDPTTVYPDMHSDSHDASDWNRCFIAVDMPKDEFEDSYPEADVIPAMDDDGDGWDMDEEEVRLLYVWDRVEKEDNLVKLSNGTVTLFSTIEEKMEEMVAADLIIVDQRKTLVYEVTRYLMSGAEILEEFKWKGRYIPIVPVYGEEFVLDGKRHWKSMFYDAMDSQKSYNYWRTSNAETVALQPKSPYIGREGAFNSDADNWATANTQNHPYLEYDGDERPTREPPPQLSQGAMAESQSADADLKDIVGIHETGLGMQGQERSGVAIDASKVNADTSNFHFVDNLSRAMRYAGRVLLDLIPQVYSDERMIRTLGWDEEVKTVQINKEFTEGQQTRIHDMTKGKYDLTVSTGASFQTKRKESVKNMMDLATSFPQVAQIIGDLVAKNSDWDGADEIAKRMKSMLPPNVLAMEEMESIPEEARPHIANAMQQTQQLQQQLQQQQAQMAEMTQQYKRLEIEYMNKKGEQANKQADTEMKALMAQLKEDSAKERLLMQGSIDAQLEEMKLNFKAISELVNNTMSNQI